MPILALLAMLFALLSRRAPAAGAALPPPPAPPVPPAPVQTMGTPPPPYLTPGGSTATPPPLYTPPAPVPGAPPAPVPGAVPADVGAMVGQLLAAPAALGGLLVQLASQPAALAAIASQAPQLAALASQILANPALATTAAQLLQANPAAAVQLAQLLAQSPTLMQLAQHALGAGGAGGAGGGLLGALGGLLGGAGAGGAGGSIPVDTGTTSDPVNAAREVAALVSSGAVRWLGAADARVLAAQRRMGGVDVDGVVGPQTAARVNALLGHEVISSRGSSTGPTGGTPVATETSTNANNLYGLLRSAPDQRLPIAARAIMDHQDTASRVPREYPRLAAAFSRAQAGMPISQAMGDAEWSDLLAMLRADAAAALYIARALGVA